MAGSGGRGANNSGDGACVRIPLRSRNFSFRVNLQLLKLQLPL